MGMVIHVADIESSIREFPNGVYEAKVTEAKYDVSKKTNDTMIVLKLEIYHPVHGTASIRDWLPPSFPAKCFAFYLALNDWTRDQVDTDDIELPEPPDLVGAEILVQLGEQESKTDGKMYKTLIGPWYYPLSRAAELLDTEDDPFAPAAD